MVRSMTGFGRGECLDADLRVTVEIRSVNHRFLEFSTKLPRRLSALENQFRERLQSQISRGKVHAGATLSGQLAGTPGPRLDEDLAERYLQILRDLKGRFALHGEPDVNAFVTLPDLLTHEEAELTPEAAWALLEPALEAALEEYDAGRLREGEALAKDLRARLAAITETIGKIEKANPEVVARVETRLRDRLAQISQDANYNQYRLEAEMVLFAERSDVTEECVRLRSHLDQFERYLGMSEPAGRRLNFLLQEMNREVNTIGSKSQGLEVTREVVFVKEEIEKIRQQVQNIE